MLELVMTHLQPAALQWALGTWSRAAASIDKVAATAALLEGKRAIQKAATLDAAHREQIVRGVLRWWRQGDLARGWAQWQAAAAHLPDIWAPEHVVAASNVHVSLGVDLSEVA